MEQCNVKSLYLEVQVKCNFGVVMTERCISGSSTGTLLSYSRPDSWNRGTDLTHFELIVSQNFKAKFDYWKGCGFGQAVLPTWKYN